MARMNKYMYIPYLFHSLPDRPNMTCKDILLLFYCIDLSTYPMYDIEIKSSD